MKVEMLVRFWNKVDKQGPTIRPELGPCWQWMACTNGRYGLFKASKEMPRAKAHRLSWTIHNGRVPPRGLEVCHSCDNQRCVNPAHLFLGTHMDNMRDRDAKGRNKPNAKITREVATRIRERLASGERPVDIARDVGLARCCISNIKAGRTWPEVKNVN